MAFLSTIAAGLLVSVVTSVLTVRLALGRYYSERWWERRLDAYTRVHDALADQLRHTKADSDAIDDYYFGDGSGRPIPENVAEEMRRTWKESERELEHALVRGTFLQSEDAVSLLQLYQRKQRELELTSPDLGWEIIEDQPEGAQAAVNEFGELAKRDLGIGRARFAWRRTLR